MNRTKAFIACITVSLTGIAVSGCASTSEAAGDDCGEHTIKIGHAIATTSPLQVGAEEFQSIIEEETDGRLTVEIFPASQLGSETDMIEQVRSGALDIVLASPAVISNTYPDAAILAMPFVIDGDSEAEQYASLQTAAASDVVAEMTEEMAAEQGMRPVDWTWWYGNRHITNGVRAIEGVDDLAGLKLRTPTRPSTSSLSKRSALRSRRWRSTSSTLHCRPARSTARRTPPARSRRPSCTRCRTTSP